MPAPPPSRSQRAGRRPSHPEAPFDFSEKAYLLPRDGPWKAAVDAWLKPILESREFARLLDKWLEHPGPRAAPGAISLEPLAELMAERLALMQDVARHKGNVKAAIEDVIREQQIIDGLKQEAEALGVPQSRVLLQRLGYAGIKGAGRRSLYESATTTRSRTLGVRTRCGS